MWGSSLPMKRLRNGYILLLSNFTPNFVFQREDRNSDVKMVEKKVKNTAMATKEERAEIKKKVTKVDPDDDDTNVHRLVQDENAKTILLNFPLEVSTSAATAAAALGPDSCCNNFGVFPAFLGMKFLRHATSRVIHKGCYLRKKDFDCYD